MTDEMIATARKAYLALLKDPRTTTAQLRKRLDEIVRNEPIILSVLAPEADRDFLKSNTPVSRSSENYYDNLGKLENSDFSRERIEYLIRVRELLKNKGARGFIPPTPSQSRESTSRVAVNYTPSNNLQQFVQEGDLPTIRTALRMELNNNTLTSADLEATMAWAQRQVPGLFEPFAEKSFARGMETDQKLWTSQYYDNQTVYLKTNFSEERFRHLISVRSLLRQQGVKGFAPLSPVAPRSNSSIRAAAHPSSKTGQTADHQKPGTTGQATAKQKDSTEWWSIPCRVFLMIGGAVAVVIVVVMFIVINLNS
ncbi:MAG: hypothetical protein ABF979_15125 [Gluconobacter sp.]|uniref:Uncharacterized protein n=1 Tax=Acetobacter aceti TaxID=435 RepID=A0A1U9KDM2_ACEAC|nr:hypothetical protein [Acetobacter aceti]AQS83876.1 hypothetical protein A0U92_02800 [Acetobacter aceti]